MSGRSVNKQECVQGEQGALGVKCNSMTTDEVILVAKRVKRDDEALAESVTGIINSSIERSAQHFSLLFDRGYSYEAMIGCTMKARRGSVAKPVNNLDVVHDQSGQFILQGP